MHTKNVHVVLQDVIVALGSLLGLKYFSHENTGRLGLELAKKTLLAM
jgi:hypothetical protein